MSPGLSHIPSEFLCKIQLYLKMAVNELSMAFKVFCLCRILDCALRGTADTCLKPQVCKHVFRGEFIWERLQERVRVGGGGLPACPSPCGQWQSRRRWMAWVALPKRRNSTDGRKQADQAHQHPASSCASSSHLLTEGGNPDGSWVGSITSSLHILRDPLVLHTQP